MGRKSWQTPEQREEEALRRESERRDERRNHTMTRGEILDAIDAALFHTGGNVGCVAEATERTLQALKDALE
jgi:hypothetical protein